MIPKVELSMKSVIASSGGDTDSVVLDPNQRDFSGNIKGFHLTLQVEYTRAQT